MKMKKRKPAKEHSEQAVAVLDNEALKDKLWQTAVEAAIPFEIAPSCARSLRAWNMIAVERMKLEGRLLPEDVAIAQSNMRNFIQLMKIEGVYLAHTDRLDYDCFHAAHRKFKRRSFVAQCTLWPFWPNEFVVNN